MEEILSSEKLKFILASIKGLRNGLIYGGKVRFPHSLVMALMFGNGNLKSKAKAILRSTLTHSTNLAKFVFLYKLSTGSLQLLCGRSLQFHSFVSAFSAGYLVFGYNNPVNLQINLYLLSRVILGILRLLIKQKVLPDVPDPKISVFPWFSAFMFGIMPWLHEYHIKTLQPSLQQSMTYLYHDCEKWTGLDDFLFCNKPGEI